MSAIFQCVRWVAANEEEIRCTSCWAQSKSSGFSFRQLSIAAAAGLTLGAMPAARAQVQYFTQSGTNYTYPVNLLPFSGNPSSLDFTGNTIQIAGNNSPGSFSALAGAQLKADGLSIAYGGNRCAGQRHVLRRRDQSRAAGWLSQPPRSGHLGHRYAHRVRRRVARRQRESDRHLRQLRQLHWQWRGIDRHADGHRYRVRGESHRRLHRRPVLGVHRSADHLRHPRRYDQRLRQRAGGRQADDRVGRLPTTMARPTATAARRSTPRCSSTARAPSGP